MVKELSQGRELARRSAGLAASGILALTLAGEHSKTADASLKYKNIAREINSDQDPFSANVDEKLKSVYKKIKSIVRQNPHAKNASYIVQKDQKNRLTFDRYTYATPISKSDSSAGYVQVVCIAEKGNTMPAGCEMLYGVPKPLATGQPYMVGSFFVRGGHDQFSLENIAMAPGGDYREDYFNKDGNSYSHKFKVAKNPWRIESVPEGKVQIPYDHFFHNLLLVLERDSAGKPPA